MISWKSTGTYIPKHEFSSTSMISKYPVIGLLLRFIVSFCNGFTNIDHKTIFVLDLFVRNCLSLVHLICKNCRDFASIPSCFTFAYQACTKFFLNCFSISVAWASDSLKLLLQLPIDERCRCSSINEEIAACNESALR